jgi:hypothetical protein
VSVGCNTISGSVRLDGDTLTIVEPLAITAMGCLGPEGEHEAMLVKILERGPFRIGPTDWVGDGASLAVEELASGGTGPNARPPDEPVGSSPGAVIVDPPMSCPPLPIGTNGTAVDGGPAVVDDAPGAVTGGGSGSSGSSGGTTTGTTEPASKPGSAPIPPTEPDPGSTLEPKEQLPDPTLIAPRPSAPVEPEPSAVTEPAPSIPAEPAPTGATVPGATGSVVDPDPGFTGVGSDPGNGKPVPIDPCWDRMYALDGIAGGAIPPKGADASSEAATAAATSSGSGLFVPIAVGSAIAVMLAFAGTRRWRSRVVVIESEDGAATRP